MRVVEAAGSPADLIVPKWDAPSAHTNSTVAMGICRQAGRNKFYLLVLVLAGLYLLYFSFPCNTATGPVMVPKESVKYVSDANNRRIPYHDRMPIIFVGGMPRSGTTLMRAMLDAHPEVRCGEETRVIPRVLGMRVQWEKSPVERRRLEEAGVTREVIDSAIRAFILEIMAKHGPAATHLCNKDPFTLKSSIYLSQQFPHAKFILMIRDGRAVVHSIITRKVTITGFDLKSYKQCLTKWNAALENMYAQCMQVGQHRCMPVYYEQLALHPKDWMVRILHFLELPWNNSVLHHEDFVEKPGGVALSKTERSTDQVIKPINVEALAKWVGAIPHSVVQDMDNIAPMLRTLGYDPRGNPPNYGKPDPMVADNTLHIQRNSDFWKMRENDILKGANAGAAEAKQSQQKEKSQKPKQQQQQQQREPQEDAKADTGGVRQNPGEGYQGNDKVDADLLAADKNLSPNERIPKR